jgi:hypothetical protein
MAFTDRSPIVMQGRVFIQERSFNGAALTGLDWVGNCDNAVLELKQKNETIKDNFTGLGLTIANPVVETDADFSISVLDMRMQNWAMGVWGEWSGAEISGAVSGEDIVMYNDRYVQLAKPGVSSVVVAGATLDTDYVVDSAPHGLLRVLPGSAAAPDGTPFATTVDYNYAANNGKVEGFVTAQKFYTIVVNGINVAQGNQPMILTVRQIQLSMTKKMDFIDKKAMKFELMGTLLQDATISLPSAPGDLSQFFSLLKA